MNQYYQPQVPYYQLGKNNMRTLGTNPTLFSSSEGFAKGNMFSNNYTPYKNYQPQVLRATSEQEQLFLQMAEADFAAHDLNLYLDLHPQDGNMLDLFNQYRRQTNQLMMEYEQKYGPLTTSSDTLNQSPFMWTAQAFPWNTGGM